MTPALKVSKKVMLQDAAALKVLAGEKVSTQTLKMIQRFMIPVLHFPRISARYELKQCLLVLKKVLTSTMLPAFLDVLYVF